MEGRDRVALKSRPERPLIRFGILTLRRPLRADCGTFDPAVDLWELCPCGVPSGPEPRTPCLLLPHGRSVADAWHGRRYGVFDEEDADDVMWQDRVDRGKGAAYQLLIMCDCDSDNL